MKPWYASKTVWFNVITTIVALATEFSNAGFPSSDLLKYYAAVITVGNIILRVFFTSTAIGNEN